MYIDTWNQYDELKLLHIQIYTVKMLCLLPPPLSPVFAGLSFAGSRPSYVAPPCPLPLPRFSVGPSNVQSQPLALTYQSGGKEHDSDYIYMYTFKY